MAVNLQKGQRVSIDNDIKMALIGLGWDPNPYDTGEDFDLDLSAFICDASGKVRSDDDFVYYNSLDWRNNTIWSTGDCRKGEFSDNGDDEQIYIDFTRIPDYVSKIVITVTIHDAEKNHQNFGQVANSYVRVAKVAGVEDQVGETVIQFDLEEEFSIETAIVACEIYRKNGQWKFNAVGSGYKGGLRKLCETYGIEVSD